MVLTQQTVGNTSSALSGWQRTLDSTTPP